MATKISAVLQSLSRELRYEPTTKRIRASLGPDLVLDSQRAFIVWEPRRVVPCYAVPATDVVGILNPATPISRTSEGITPLPVLHPGIPFNRHSTPGTSLDVSAGGATAEGGAFQFDDADLQGYVGFDSDAFSWLEEEEAVQSHPRDPFHRVDIRHSSRHIRVSYGDTVLAESTAPIMVFETGMAERIYLPSAEVNWAALAPTDSVTLCPYKGAASYWRLAGELGAIAESDVVWSYQEPLPEAVEIAGYVCFYDNLVDVKEL